MRGLEAVRCLTHFPERAPKSVLLWMFPRPLLLHFQDAKGAPTMEGILELKHQLLPGRRQVSTRRSLPQQLPCQSHARSQRALGGS